MAHLLLIRKVARFVHMEVPMKRVLVASIGALAATYGLTAHAQEDRQQGYFVKELAAPWSAFEIGVSGSYNQGFGDLTSGGNRVQDTSQAGGGFELDLGWRVLPQLSLGVYGAGSQFSRASAALSGTDIQSVAAGVQAQWFLRPYTGLNPWLGLGTGYRGYFIEPSGGGATALHGWEIARVQAGLDFRASREVSIGPFIGGSVDTFLAEKQPGTGYQNLSGPAVAGFVEAGLVGRFDIGGRYIQRSRVIAGR
jgi:hypothetical protein